MKENEKIDFIEQILIDKYANQDEIDYAVGRTNSWPLYSGIYYWIEIFNKVADKLDLDDKFMHRLYRLSIREASSDVYEFLENKIHQKNDNREKSLYKILSILGDTEERKIYTALKLTSQNPLYDEVVANFLIKQDKKIVEKILKDISYLYPYYSLLKELTKIDKNNYYSIIIELYNNYDSKDSLLGTMLEIMNQVKEKDEVKQNIILNITLDYFKESKYKDKDINLIKDFLNNKLTRKTEKNYYKLAEKSIKKLEKEYNGPSFLKQIIGWFIKSKDILENPFYKNFQNFLFDFFPTHSCEVYFDNILYVKEKISENVIEIIKQYNIPTKTYLIYLVHSLNNSFYSVIEDINTAELKRYITDYFDTLLEIMDITTLESQIQLLDILYNKDNNKTLDFLLTFSQKATSKRLKSHIISIFDKSYTSFNDTQKKELSDKLISLLKSKKKSSREISVALLIKWNLPENEKLLKPMLEDKSKDIVNIISEYLTLSLEDRERDNFFSKKVILERAKKKQVNVYGIDKIPNMIWKETSEELPQYFTIYLISLLKKGGKILKATEETRKILSLLTDESIANLYTSFNKIAREYDEALRLVPFTKDDKYLIFLKDYITQLIQSYRGAAASKIVPIIASFKTTKAIQLLDHLTLKKNAKDARVNRAALASLDSMAKEMNLTKEDLLDYIIPTFGFSKEGIINLDFGPRQFEIKLLADLSLSIVDNKGKKFKNLPKVGKNDDSEKGNEATKLFKSIKKDLKKQVKLEKNRLERGFSTARVWSGKSWLNLFVNNPIMRIFATNLIWGKYEDGELSLAFRYLEDGTFSDFEDNELSITDNDKISLVHPIELCEDGLQAWRENLEDYEINQPFEQINREIYEYDKKAGDSLVIEEFKGYMLGRFALKNGMTKFAWQRGPVEDAGVYYSYSKNYDNGFSFILNFLGDYIGNYDDNKEIPLYDISIYKNGEPTSLKNIPKRLYSELHYELKRVTDKGSGFNENWQLVQW